MKARSSMNEKYYILYNPYAGNGKSRQTAESLNYKSAEIVSMTDITSYAEFFADKREASIVVCGGDGTLNRFINEIDGIPHGDIYYMASGSGNDFLRDIEIFDQKEPVLINKYIENLPICEVDGRKIKVLNGVGYGIDGYCCLVGEKLKTENAKKINYTSIAIGGLLGKYKTCGGKITVDGEEHRFKKIWLAPGMNGRFFGGGMMPCPNQKRLNGKGEVSVCVFHDTSNLQTLLIFPSLFKGEHIKNTKKVWTASGKHITVEFDSPTPLQIDGETIDGVTKYSISYQ